MGKFFATTDPSVTDREKEHLSLARKMAGDSAVLLENDGTLPLPAPGLVALFGNGARHTVRGGTGSGDVNTRSDVTIEQGLLNAGFMIATQAWLDRQDERHAQAKRAYRAWVPVCAAEQGISEFLVRFSHPFRIPAPCPVEEGDLKADGADTAIFVISRTSGEGADRDTARGDYLLYEEELEGIRRVTAAFTHTIIVLNVGGVIDTTEFMAIPGISSVLLMGQMGSSGGDALSDLLLGRVNPSGRLTDTWAKQYVDYPSAMTYSHMNGNLDDEYYIEGILVGYRWFDAMGIEPKYPFGYGLSYTDFSLSEPETELQGTECVMRVTVRNIGGMPGRDVVQVYAELPKGILPKAPRGLIAFAKTALLKPGQLERVEMRFPIANLASYSEKHAAWVLEAGEYRILYGQHSRDTADAAVLTLAEAVVVRQLRNLFSDTDPVRETTVPMYLKQKAAASVPRIPIDPSMLRSKEPVYTQMRKPCSTDKIRRLTLADVREGRSSASELVAQLSVSELASLCVGALRTNGLLVGSDSQLVPGAAGETSSALLASRGIRSLVMADGPAGLRLTPVFRTDLEGSVLPGGVIFGDEERPSDPGLNEENSIAYYQYCTAIPIGWNLAMSWDPDLIRETAAMVGQEMVLFGVDLWLAPALNIHRNPLCGRNFEYNSEDPLLAGSVAAAISEGVQRVSGRGVCVKHFAVNSQEDNRYFTNAHVSERALREIYLRGFEIAVKTGKPASVMTSYNLINGTHTANHFDLLQGVLRDEWGYEGLVMTDWFTSQDVPDLTGSGEKKYGISSSVGCIAAGNDLQMPGCEKNAEDILRAVESGETVDRYRITRADLETCALRVIRAVLRTEAEQV